MVPSGAFVLLSIISAVYAKNNWSVPCWDGVCEYDNAFGGMKIVRVLPLPRYSGL
jgi:hypothetical protein